MILIKNGNVHDGRGNTGKLDVLIDGGRIAKVEKNISAPGAETVDASGMEVMPGFVNAISAWGIMGPGWSGDDKSEASDPVTPEMDVTYAFDHDGMNFQRVYEYGVTSAGVAPVPSNIVAGRGAVYKTYGRTPHGMLVKADNAMIASVTKGVKDAYEKRGVAPMTRMGIFSMLVASLEKAKRYDMEKEGYDAKSIAMKKVVEGDEPLFVNCSTKAEIDGVYRALAGFPKVRLVLTGAYAIDETMEQVVSGRTPVIMGDFTEAYVRSNLLCDMKKVIAMMGSGANIAIACCGDGMTAGKESLLWNAILWHKHGLDAERTLAAITSVPAGILGVGDRVGAIAPGLDADICIWSKNPIETYEANIVRAYISGEDLKAKEAYVSCW